MNDFKQKKALNPAQSMKSERQNTGQTTPAAGLLDIKDGWYDGQLNFKRVVMKAQTGKFEYKDTHVEYQCKAISGMDCYNRIVGYLKTKVDLRSQFPSAKGSNFKFKYLGKCKQAAV